MCVRGWCVTSIKVKQNDCDTLANMIEKASILSNKVYSIQCQQGGKKQQEKQKQKRGEQSEEFKGPESLEAHISRSEQKVFELQERLDKEYLPCEWYDLKHKQVGALKSLLSLEEMMNLSPRHKHHSCS